MAVSISASTFGNDEARAAVSAATSEYHQLTPSLDTTTYYNIHCVTEAHEHAHIPGRLPVLGRPPTAESFTMMVSIGERKQGKMILKKLNVTTCTQQLYARAVRTRCGHMWPWGQMHDSLNPPDTKPEYD